MTGSGPFDGQRSPQSIGAVTAWLREQGLGRDAVSYRLRDWLISRQRAWGAPIPIVHCEEHGEVPVPEGELPVLLPEDLDFTPRGESPLAKHEGFVKTECPRCGRPARRETDTMDTFVDSSWYFLRYPHLDPERAIDPQAVDRWLPADQYTGGVEHAILHLLYSRFVTKVLHDEGLLGFREPFLRLRNQGQVVYDGAAMSKSRGNLVEPMPLVDRFGADTVRVTMLFANGFEDDVDWKNVSPEGVHHWLGRVWRAVWDAASRDAAGGGGQGDPETLRRATHRRIASVTEDLPRYKFNTAIARLMELTNEIRATLDGGAAAREAATALVQMMAPLAPFIAEELWREALGGASSVHTSAWPAFDPELARADSVTLVVQVDGKVRDRIDVPADASEEACREAAMASDRARRAVGDREIARVIVRAPRLVSIVTGG
jgi:leucyl-tRNA synthetase